MQTTEITVKVKNVRDLFREREFDPFEDDVESVRSIAAMAQLPHLVSKLRESSLRVLVPAEKYTPQTEAQVRHALRRYAEHMIADAQRRLAALRWVGVRSFAIGLIFFGISLVASNAVGRAHFLPEELRTLASESLIVAGWVVIWQPLDTLVAGWWPQWKEVRTFRAIGALPIRIEPVSEP